jgi:HEPN domain-containing protein
MSAPFSIRPDFEPGRLCSLWDLMIKFDVRLMIVRMSHLERFEKELRGHMPPEDRPLEPQMKARGMPMWESDEEPAFATEAGRQWIWAYVRPMQDELAPLGLAASQLRILHILSHADRWSRKQLADGFAALRWTIEQELNEKFFLFLTTEEAKLFNNAEPCGPKVAAAFPSANNELKEAAECIAINKGTAAVFHCMRAVEIGIKALASDVGKTYDVQQWNVILNEIEAEIGNMRRNGIPGLSKQQKDEKLEFLSRAATQIGYFKDGWRNYATHNKRAYDVNEATSVYDHVGAFMAILSERLCE